MSPIARRKGIIILLFGLILLTAGCSDRNSKTSVNPDTGKHYIAGWASPDSHGAWAKRSTAEGGMASCQECHGEDFSGGISETACSACHGVNAPHPQAWTIGARKHSGTDQSNADVCAVCHANGANSPLQPITPAAPGTTPGCFNNTLCHDQNMGHAPGWASPDAHGPSVKAQANGFGGCKACHGADFTGGTAMIACSSCHGVSAPHPATPWIATSPTVTRTHTTTNAGNASVCADCHAGGANLTSIPTPTPAPPAGTAAGCFNNTLCHAQIGHPVGWAGADVHGAAAKSAPTASNMTGFSTCQTCHGNDFAGNTAATCLNTAGCHGAGVASPHASPWQSTSTRKHSTTDEANAPACGLCHLGNVQPPTYAPLATAVGCFDGTLCHTGSTGCVNCHNAGVNAPKASLASSGTVTTRRAIVPEFQQAWSHKRSGGNVVADQDCAVCHMEGNVADGSRNLAYHGNGTMELRDPDTGTTIKQSAWSNTPAGAGSFSSGGSDATFVRFSRNLGTNLVSDVNYAKLAGIMMNQCLKCHDADGATSASARVPGGTAEKPFATTISGAGYAGAGVTANGVTGGVTDISAAFSTANSSYHPVRGKQDNSYTSNARMNAPWNAAKTPGSVGQWGYLMTCWDCHALSTDAGTITRTVTAHGAPATVRGEIWRTGAVGASNNTTFCIVCHAGYNTNTATNHGSGSAWNSAGADSGMNNYIRYACYYCHSSNATKPARPTPGEDVHGFNRLRKASSTDFLWPVGATETYPPYAFIRAGFTTQHKPLSGAGVPAGSATCSGYDGTNGSSTCSRGSMGNYSPGGIF